MRTIHDGFPTYCHWVRTVHDVLWVKASYGEPYNNTSWHALGYYRSYPHDTSLAVFVVSSHKIHKPRNYNPYFTELKSIFYGKDLFLIWYFYALCVYLQHIIN